MTSSWYDTSPMERGRLQHQRETEKDVGTPGCGRPLGPTRTISRPKASLLRQCLLRQPGNHRRLETNWQQPRGARRSLQPWGSLRLRAKFLCQPCVKTVAGVRVLPTPRPATQHTHPCLRAQSKHAERREAEHEPAQTHTQKSNS
jgi:hypothetical protein